MRIGDRLMANRAKDWFAQAERDLEQAIDSKRAGRDEWACFASHQAAEKAVKALHLSLGQEAWGHVVARLIRELPSRVSTPEDLIEKAHVLDTFYVASRYPNSHVEGAPFEPWIGLFAPGLMPSLALGRRYCGSDTSAPTLGATGGWGVISISSSSWRGRNFRSSGGESAGIRAPFRFLLTFWSILRRNGRRSKTRGDFRRCFSPIPFGSMPGSKA